MVLDNSRLSVDVNTKISKLQSKTQRYLRDKDSEFEQVKLKQLAIKKGVRIDMKYPKQKLMSTKQRTRCNVIAL